MKNAALTLAGVFVVGVLGLFTYFVVDPHLPLLVLGLVAMVVMGAIGSVITVGIMLWSLARNTGNQTQSSGRPQAASASSADKTLKVFRYLGSAASIVVLQIVVAIAAAVLLDIRGVKIDLSKALNERSFVVFLPLVLLAVVDLVLCFEIDVKFYEFWRRTVVIPRWARGISLEAFIRRLAAEEGEAQRVELEKFMVAQAAALDERLPKDLFQLEASEYNSKLARVRAFSDQRDRAIEEAEDDLVRIKTSSVTEVAGVSHAERIERAEAHIQHVKEAWRLKMERVAADEAAITAHELYTNLIKQLEQQHNAGQRDLIREFYERPTTDELRHYGDGDLKVGILVHYPGKYHGQRKPPMCIPAAGSWMSRPILVLGMVIMTSATFLQPASRLLGQGLLSFWFIAAGICMTAMLTLFVSKAKIYVHDVPQRAADLVEVVTRKGYLALTYVWYARFPWERRVRRKAKQEISVQTMKRQDDGSYVEETETHELDHLGFESEHPFHKVLKDWTQQFPSVTVDTANHIPMTVKISLANLVIWCLVRVIYGPGSLPRTMAEAIYPVIRQFASDLEASELLRSSDELAQRIQDELDRKLWKYGVSMLVRIQGVEIAAEMMTELIALENAKVAYRRAVEEAKADRVRAEAALDALNNGLERYLNGLGLTGEENKRARREAAERYMFAQKIEKVENLNMVDGLRSLENLFGLKKAA